jgi:hypothetical protein
MTVRHLPKKRWILLAAVMLIAALSFHLLTAPPPLTLAERPLVGTWVEQSPGDPAADTSQTSHLTFGPDHFVTKSDFVFGPDARPQNYRFTWRLDEEGLVMQHVVDSLIDRLRGRVSTPEFFGVVSVTPTTITLRRADGSQAVLIRFNPARDRADTHR